MIRIKNIRVCPKENIDIKYLASKKLKVNQYDIKDVTIHKMSIDARNKKMFAYVYDLDVTIDNENKYVGKDVILVENEDYVLPQMGNNILSNRPIVVGAGPAGLFCTYMLAKYGYKPILIERGEKIEDRVKSVGEFWQNNKFTKNSNVQFGEGGAGTFSDGKLNTLVKDKENRMREVFKIFVECGAPQEIMYDSKPHIGTDILVLAIGHSARDTFKMLVKNNLNLVSKPFAVGVRIIHPQDMINENQYPINYPFLPPASYKLTYKSKSGRGIYSFCMCPGGYVVNAKSENDGICVNGMSNYKRDTKYANSAIVVTVGPNDYGVNILDGMYFQEMIEKRAYKICDGLIPVQGYEDYKNNVVSKNIDIDAFKGNIGYGNINDIFPEFINDSLKEGIDYFDNKIKGFNGKDAIIAAPETRTSSPIRILRDENLEASIKGIYPCGEGAGYAGGITTSAMDGIKIFESIYKTYKN